MPKYTKKQQEVLDMLMAGAADASAHVIKGYSRPSVLYVNGTVSRVVSSIIDAIAPELARYEITVPGTVRRETVLIHKSSPLIEQQRRERAEAEAAQQAQLEAEERAKRDAYTGSDLALRIAEGVLNHIYDDKYALAREIDAIMQEVSSPA